MATRQRPVCFNADQVLARVMHYRDNDKLLYSDDEEDIDRQLLGIDDDSSEDSSSDDDETAGPSVDALETQQTCVIDLRSRSVEICRSFSGLFIWSSVSKNEYIT